MPMFHYEATDRNGKTVIGSMDARDESTVRARLAQGGYQPTLIEGPGMSAPSRGARPAPPPPPPGSPDPYGVPGSPGAPGGAPYRTMGGGSPYGIGIAGPGGPSAGRYGAESASGAAWAATDLPEEANRPGVSVSTRSLAQFYRQMATAVRSGVPLTQALPSIKSQTHDATMRRALEDIDAAVARGRPISEAMALHPRAFSIGHVGLVRAGEGGGFLDKAFEELATQAEADWGVEAATKFNIILFLVKWVALPFLAGWLYWMVHFIPQMTKDQGFNVAAFTRISVMATIVFIVTALILNVALPLLWKLTKGTRIGDLVANLSNGIPLLSARRRRVDMVKTLSSLSSAMGAGVPPSIAWQLASEAADTPYFRRAMASQRHAVRQGVPLPDLLAATGLYDQDTLNMIRSGEVSGNTPEMLAQAVHFQREEAKHIGNLTPWILGVAAYFLLLVIAAAMFIWAASKVYSGIIDRGLAM